MEHAAQGGRRFVRTTERYDTTAELGEFRHTSDAVAVLLSNWTADGVNTNALDENLERENATLSTAWVFEEISFSHHASHDEFKELFSGIIPDKREINKEKHALSHRPCEGHVKDRSHAMGYAMSYVDTSTASKACIHLRNTFPNVKLTWYNCLNIYLFTRDVHPGMRMGGYAGWPNYVTSKQHHTISAIAHASTIPFRGKSKFRRRHPIVNLRC
jgi:hypothetical protein